MNKYEFLIESGMSCQSCAMRLETSLLKNIRIKQASVNFATRQLSVSSELETKELEMTINSLGFTVSSINNFSLYSQKELQIQNQNFIRLLLAFLFSIPVVVLAMFHLNFIGSEFIQFILTTLLFIFPARLFFKNAFMAAKNKSTNMDTLVSISALSAWSYSSYLLFVEKTNNHLYFETACMLLSFILIGKFFEEKSKFQAGKTLRELALLKPENANLITQNNGQEIIETISIQLIEVNQILLVRAGEKIPADGVVVEGKSEMDTSFITGESLPISIVPESPVIGGCLNRTSSFKMRVTHIGQNSQLEQIIQLVNKAQNSKIQLQKIADKVSQIFIPLVFIIALVTYLSWYFFTHNFEHSLMSTISVLAVACPCALGLATPIAVLVATSKAAKEGILVRDAIGLEQLGKIDTIVFDKTGTLTEGNIQVQNYFSIDPKQDEKILPMVFLVEQHSSHPISQAIFKWLNDMQINNSNTKQLKENQQAFLQPEYIQEVHGVGIEWSVQSQNTEEHYFIGKIDEEHLIANELQWFNSLRVKNLNSASSIGIFQNKNLIGVFFLADTIRKSSYELIKTLQKNQIHTILATGDNLNSAKYVADELQIKEYYANQLPQNKYNLVLMLKSLRKKVALVGDGINDAAALTEADVGVAMGSGTQIAGQCAHIILQKNDLGKIIRSIFLARRTKSIIVQNLFFAFSYNIVLIPLAAFGKLNPMVAAACMGASSIIVVLNSLRIK